VKMILKRTSKLVVAWASIPSLARFIMFAGNFAPRNWALCDGQLLQISQNPALFSLLGTIYGGDGRTTFGLPDLRGQIPVHAGDGPGLPPRSLGEKSGTETNTLALNQPASHSHTAAVSLDFLAGRVTEVTEVTTTTNSATTASTATATTTTTTTASITSMTPTTSSTTSTSEETNIKACKDRKGRINIVDSLNICAVGTDVEWAVKGLPGEQGPEGYTDIKGMFIKFEKEDPMDTMPLSNISVTVENAGGGQAVNNMQPFTAVNYIIALQGTFPSRNRRDLKGEIKDGIEEEEQGQRQLGGSDPFLGEIIMFGSNFAPRGWALCDGQLLPISENSALFSLLGTIYGGDGRVTFGLPDLRGRVPIHEGEGPGLSNRNIGAKSGSASNTLNVNQLPSHDHVATTELEFVHGIVTEVMEATMTTMGP